MLSLTIHNEPDLVCFKLKGDMANGALDELRSYYRLLSTFPHEKSIVVDLSAVQSIGKAGKALLEQMSQDGAQFVLNDRVQSLRDILNLRAPAAASADLRMGAPAQKEIAPPVSFKNVLFPTDFSPNSLRALPYAEAIARGYGSKIYLAHVIPSDVYSQVPLESRDTLLQEARVAIELQLSELARSLREIPHEVIVEHGEVCPALSVVARRNNIDLVVLGTHGRRGARKLLMGSVAEEIFRFADHPVLTVGPHTPAKPPGGGLLRCVLYATDFSHASLHAMDYAFGLAHEHHARLLFLHVSHVIAEEPVRARVKAREFIEQRLREIGMQRAPEGVGPEVLVEFGSAADRILEVAHRKRADLIVLGVRSGTGSLRRVAAHLPGPTAYTVVTEAKVPVLTIHG